MSLGLWLFFVENVLFPNQHQEYGVLSLAAYLDGRTTAEPQLLDFAASQGQTPTMFMLPVPSWVHPAWMICAGLLSLVVARKGVYTDLAKWAKARGHTHLRVDGEFLPVDPWPRLDRFKEHTIELPVGDIVVGKHIGRMMAMLGGRLGAYRDAHAAGDLGPALVRNLYRGAAPAPGAVEHVASELGALREDLTAIPLPTLVEGALP